MILFEPARDLAVQAVSDHFCQLFHKLFLFGIAAMMVTLIRVVPVIDKYAFVYFLYHDLPLFLPLSK